MAGDLLTSEERAHFLRSMRRQLDSAVHRRMNVLLLLDDGWPPVQICAALFIDEGTVREHRALYERAGRAGIEELACRGATSPLPSPHLAEIEAFIDAHVPQTAREICAFVEARFEMRYTPHALAKLLKRRGYVYKKPVNVPAKADAEAQRAFAEQTLLPLMRAASAAVPLYFADATHPSYTGRPAHGWIRRGRTVELTSKHGRVRININAALSWPGRNLVHREEELITSAAMIRLYDDLVAHHPAEGPITVVIDNAKYNVSREIKAYLATPGCRIRLVDLPSYAPNLNLIERFWAFMKRKVLFNKAYAKFALFRRAFLDFLADLAPYADDLKSLLTDRFHFIGAKENGISAA
jgi:transposase